MLIYFLRHAEAEDGANDFDRKLTRKGLEQSEKAGKFLVHHGILPDLILTSPLVRAAQTARAVAAKLRDATLLERPWLASGMTPAVCLNELHALERKPALLLVGHEPDFSRAIAWLIGLADASTINVRKASLAAVELSDFTAGQGELQFLIPPRLM